MTTTQVVPKLECDELWKSFGKVSALKGVSLSLAPGEIVGLVGDNGAGKSTLVKIISGFHQPDAGTLRVDGRAVSLRSVRDAREAGIETVFQDLALVNQMRVYQNLFLNREMLRSRYFRLVSNGVMKQRAQERLSTIGITIPDVGARVGSLSGGQRQAIAIARALEASASVLVLDEPLAAMGAREGAMVLRVLERIREAREASVMLIAHNYSHLMHIADRIVILRHGKIAFDKPTSATSTQEITELMVDDYLRALSDPGARSSE
jgi:simple sugar transport system ATP-binding protein